MHGCLDVYKRQDQHDPDGTNIMLLGLDVLPEHQHQGLARELMEQYKEREQVKGRKKLILTCLPDKVEMYKKFGFKDHGIGDSVWGLSLIHICILKSIQMEKQPLSFV